MNTLSLEKRAVRSESGAYLPEEGEKLYKEMCRSYERNKEKTIEEISLWKRFTFLFLSEGYASHGELFKQYAKKPETFNINNFLIVPLMLRDGFARLIDQPYGLRGFSIQERISNTSLYLDSPHGFTLLFKNKKNQFGVVSTISFHPHFESGTLLVDQLQGAGAKGSTREARSARMKFTVYPEEILFKLAGDVARKMGLHTIGLRKPMANQWGEIYDKAFKGELTIYDRVVGLEEMRNHQEGEDNEYFYKSL